MDLLLVPALLVLSGAALGARAAGTPMIGVQVPTQVDGFLGESVTLSCHLQPPPDDSIQVTQITWTKERVEGSLAVFHPRLGAVYQDPERMKLVAVEQDTHLPDASLELSSLRIEDEANYTCIYATFPKGSSKASTSLRVLARPQISAIALKPPRPLCCESASGHPPTSAPVPAAGCVPWEAAPSSAPAREAPCLRPGERPPAPAPALCALPEALPPAAAPAPVPVACCVSAAGRPAARLSWSTPLQGVTTTSQVPGSQPGTVSDISLFSVVPSSQADGRTVTCVVEHPTLKEPLRLPVSLAVHYRPEVSITGYNKGTWNIGLRDATLSCNIQSNPEPTHFHWTTTSGTLPPSAQAQGTQLHIAVVDEAINTTFICNATNAMGTGQAEETIILGERPPSSLAPGAIAGIVVGVIAFVILVSLFLYKCHGWQQSRQSRQSNPSTNGGVLYSSVNREVVTL